MNFLRNVLLSILLLLPIPLFGAAQQDGKIILLNGTSSAGKSSIVRELVPMLAGQTEIVSFDGMGYTIARERIIAQRGTSEPVTNLDIDGYFESLAEADQYVLNSEIMTRMCNCIRTCYQNGKNVIVDTVLDQKVEWELYTKMLHELPVHFILVYCPLEPLFQHLMERNQSPDEKEHRGLSVPFDQFFTMYKRRITAAERYVDMLTRKQFNDVVERIKSVAKQYEKHSDRLEEFLVAIDKQAPLTCKEFGLTEQEAVEITSVFAHGMMVDTAHATSHDCAQQILDYVQR